MKKQLSVPILIIILLSSCTTTMKVNVDIIDRYAIYHSKIYQDAIAGDKVTPEKIRAAYTNKANEVFDEARSSGYINPNSDTAAINAAITSFVKNLTLVNTLQDANIKFDSLKNTLAPYTNNDDQPKLNNLLEQNKPNVQEVKTIFGNGISGDTLASLVASAPEKYWEKYDEHVNIITDDPSNYAKKKHQPARMNKTIVRTFFGNADIAIKMDQPGYFTIKGVRLDADQAIKASFKVLNQGIKYMAYTKGIPVNSPAGSADNSGKIVKIPEINDNDSLKAIANNLGSNKREATILFFNLLFSQSKSLDPTTHPTDAQVKQAIDLIQQSYSIYIKQLQTN